MNSWREHSASEGVQRAWQHFDPPVPFAEAVAEAHQLPMLPVRTAWYLDEHGAAVVAMIEYVGFTTVSRCI